MDVAEFQALNRRAFPDRDPRREPDVCVVLLALGLFFGPPQFAPSNR